MSGQSSDPLQNGNSFGQSASTISDKANGQVSSAAFIALTLIPGNAYLIRASLSLHGDASAKAGETVSYNGDFSNTVDFLGAYFYTDDTYAEALPTLNLNSLLGFNYAPIEITSDGPSGVPEPGSLALLATGLLCLVVRSFQHLSTRHHAQVAARGL